MQSLTQFLLLLAENEVAREAFAADPAGAMEVAGLTDEEKAAILSKDEHRIRSLVAPEDADKAEGIKILILIIIKF